MIVWRVLRGVLFGGAVAVVTLAQLNLPKAAWGELVTIQWIAVCTLVLLTV